MTEPQPRSNADNNGNGANTTGPYDSTRHGLASFNGNGDGKATGKPCAGCVGKADNKNPSGQLPGPQDNNNGYECDGNNGIAKTNPAHTGCATAATPPSGETPGGPSTPPSGGVLGSSSTPPSGEVLGETVTRSSSNPSSPAEVLGETVTRPSAAAAAATLPRTGIDAADWATFAALLIAAGVFTLVTTRRLQHHHV